MNVDCSRTHRGEETPLVQISHDGVGVHELWGTTEVVRVGFLSPAGHWPPGGAL